MKKDRKRRKEAIRRLEGLEYWNKSARNVTTVDVVAALCPKLLRNVYTGELNLETCAELLQEVKSLVDIKDYMSCPRSREREAIHIGDRVYKVDGDGEPLIVEEIIVRHGGTLVQCSYANNTENTRENHIRRRLTRLSFFSRELTFEEPNITAIHLNEIKQSFSCTITKDGIEWHYLD